MRFIKSTGKLLICSLLERQVKKLRTKHNFKVIAVVGSVGKTSTKLALAQTLNDHMKVLWQEGNYNDRLTVPLIFFGHQQPGLFNVFAWTKILTQNFITIHSGKYNYDVVVVELGTDGPGQMDKFAYIKPDISIVTSIGPEHMEYFADINAVANEELSVTKFSTQLLINQDDVAKIYYQNLPKYKTYGAKEGDYRATSVVSLGLDGQTATVVLGDKQINITTQFLGEHGLRIILPAVICAHFFGVNDDDISRSIKNLQPFSGRTQLLLGIRNSHIIDDSYNASPQAVKASLEMLYSLSSSHKIALLGNMNELGKFAEEEHRQIGRLCDSTKLSLVVTLGQEANEFLATEAKARGCRVIRTNSPYEAGERIKENIEADSIILVKGSQNGVFAEEAIKSILADPNDANKLVRQSTHWLNVKQKQFGNHV